MNIYLFRHGIAEDRAASGADRDRALTDEGRRKLRCVLERAAAAGVAPTLILTSPLRRAVQTAEVAAEVLGYKGKIVRTPSLSPGGSPEGVWAELRSRPDERAVLLAGHEPLFGQAAAYLLGTPALRINMKKGALVRIECERLTGPPEGLLHWILTPRLAGCSE